MIIHVYSGLMSRCCVLSQAYKLAKEYNDELTIIWPLEPACYIHYEEVFDGKQFEDISVKVIEYVYPNLYKDLKKVICDTGIKGITSELKFRKLIKNAELIEYNPLPGMGWYGENFEMYLKSRWARFFELCQNGEANRIYAHPFNSIVYDSDFDNKCFSDIVFGQEYYKSVERIIPKNENIIGLHVRRTDHVDAISHSSIEGFFEKIDAEIADDAGCKFFLATDSLEEEEKLLDKYGNRVIVQSEKIWGRDSSSAVMSGILDMLCLSKCKKIYGSYMSIFSKFAAEYGKIPIEYIE